MPEIPILYIAARTDVGRIRGHNEDDFLVCRNIAAEEWMFDTSGAASGAKGALIVIADGMGGEDAGEVAAKLAVDTIKNTFSALPEQVFTDRDACNFMESVVMAAHDAITADATENTAHSRMGTTVVMAWILNQSAHIAWVGDSRCYLLRQGRLSLLTDDHAPVWDMVRKGKLSAEEARAHPDSNFISQHLGQKKEKLKPDVKTLMLQDNDVLLLCSDGLNSMLADAQIEGILHKNITVQAAAAELVNAANAAGGYDNITVALVKYNGDELIAPAAQDTKTGFKTASQNLDDLPTAPISDDLVKLPQKQKSNRAGIFVLLVVLAALAWTFKTFVWDKQPNSNDPTPNNDIIEQAPPGTKSDTPETHTNIHFNRTPTTTASPPTPETATVPAANTPTDDTALKALLVRLVHEKNDLKLDMDRCVNKFKKNNTPLNPELSKNQDMVNGLYPRIANIANFSPDGKFISWKINTNNSSQTAQIYQLETDIGKYKYVYNRLCNTSSPSPQIAPKTDKPQLLEPESPKITPQTTEEKPQPIAPEKKDNPEEDNTDQ